MGRCPALLFISRKGWVELSGNKKGNTVDIVAAIAKPVVEEMGLTLWDVRYEKEGAYWYLRVFIDKEGGVSIDDCENVSRRLDPMIDEADPIGQAYYFEVSSPGIGRDLVRDWHFEKYMGETIEIRLIRPEAGVRDFMGRLIRNTADSVTIEIDGQEKEIIKKDTAFIRLYEEIDMNKNID